MARDLKTVNLINLLICSTIGSGIFFLPNSILGNTKSVPIALICWILAGLVAILFGLCYSELGATYPFEGGDSVYLSKAYGNITGNLYSIISLFVILPLRCAFISQNICGSLSVNYSHILIMKIILLLSLSVINLYGNNLVIRLQYVLTILKMIIVAVFIILAVLVFVKAVKVKGDKKCAIETMNQPVDDKMGDVGYGKKRIFGVIIAFYSTLWSYDGWNSGNFIAHRIYNPAKTFPVSIITSLIIVIFTYLLINVSYFYVLSYNTIVKEDTRLIYSYIENLEINSFLGNLIIKCASVIPALGTLNGSFLVAASIIDYFIQDYRGKEKLKIAAVILFALIIFAITFVKNVTFIISKINFFTYIFYGMSTAAILVLRRKEKNVVRSFKAPNIVIYFCILFAAFIVLFAIFRLFI